MSPRWRKCVAVATLLTINACDDGSSTPSAAHVESTMTAPIPFGSATVEPSTAKRGDRITVTPSAEIWPFCDPVADVRPLDGDGPEIQFWSGSWAPYDAVPGPTWLTCMPPASSRPMSFTVADDFPLGSFTICITWKPDENGCGTFTVVEQ